MRNPSDSPAWIGTTLRLAGLYNLAFGAFVVLFPGALFAWAEMDPPRYLQIWQCVGMMVGVYGVGFLIAAGDPFRYWPVVLVGFLGKTFGPAGFLMAAMNGELPWRAGWVIVTNDLIWWLPFAMILHRSATMASAGIANAGQDREPQPPAGLLKRLLAKDWSTLAPAIRELHAGTSRLRANGRFEIRHGEGRCARLVAHLSGLPPPGTLIDTAIEIRPDARGETWVRTFDGRRLASRVREENGLLMEQFTIGEFTLLPSVASSGLEIRSSAFALRLGSIRIALPTALAPVTSARVIADGADRVSAQVTVTHPWIGTLLEYQGRLERDRS